MVHCRLHLPRAGGVHFRWEKSLKTPYGSMAREATRAIRFLGAEGLIYELFSGRWAKDAPYQNRITISFVEPSEDVG